jgi:hypothetical protein
VTDPPHDNWHIVEICIYVKCEINLFAVLWRIIKLVNEKQTEFNTTQNKTKNLHKFRNLIAPNFSGRGENAALATDEGLIPCIQLKTMQDSQTENQPQLFCVNIQNNCFQKESHDYYR